MITPVIETQSNINFKALRKAPKLTTSAKRSGTKIKDFGAKIKKEFYNLDEESKMHLYKSTILLSIITLMLFQIGHFVKLVMDKIHYFTE